MSMTPSARRWTLCLAGAALGMLALSFAAEPLYSTFCKVTGFGGETRVAKEEAAAKVKPIDRPIRVRFDANVDPGLPLHFVAEQGHLDLKLGERVMAFYEVTNTSDQPVTATAAYNVAPHKAGVYFNKIECFCFKTAVYQPGVTQRLPVIFYISPELETDRFARDIQTITLSYTYYGSAGAAASASLGESGTVN
jgi:cytochrome c oxidase assembly protein subunit 11